MIPHSLSTNHNIPEVTVLYVTVTKNLKCENVKTFYCQKLN